MVCRYRPMRQTFTDTRMIDIPLGLSLALADLCTMLRGRQHRFAEKMSRERCFSQLSFSDHRRLGCEFVAFLSLDLQTLVTLNRHAQG